MWSSFERWFFCTVIVHCTSWFLTHVSHPIIWYILLMQHLRIGDNTFNIELIIMRAKEILTGIKTSLERWKGRVFPAHPLLPFQSDQMVIPTAVVLLSNNSTLFDYLLSFALLLDKNRRFTSFYINSYFSWRVFSVLRGILLFWKYCISCPIKDHF